MDILHHPDKNEDCKVRLNFHPISIQAQIIKLKTTNCKTFWSLQVDYMKKPVFQRAHASKVSKSMQQSLQIKNLPSSSVPACKKQMENITVFSK